MENNKISHAARVHHLNNVTFDRSQQSLCLSSFAASHLPPGAAFYLSANVSLRMECVCDTYFGRKSAKAAQ